MVISTVERKTRDFLRIYFFLLVISSAPFAMHTMKSGQSNKNWFSRFEDGGCRLFFLVHYITYAPSQSLKRENEGTYRINFEMGANGRDKLVVDGRMGWEAVVIRVMFAKRLLRVCLTWKHRYCDPIFGKDISSSVCWWWWWWWELRSQNVIIDYLEVLLGNRKGFVVSKEFIEIVRVGGEEGFLFKTTRYRACCMLWELSFVHSVRLLSLIHIWRCRRSTLCRSRWSPYH